MPLTKALRLWYLWCNDNTCLVFFAQVALVAALGVKTGLARNRAVPATMPRFIAVCAFSLWRLDLFGASLFSPFPFP